MKRIFVKLNTCPIVTFNQINGYDFNLYSFLDDCYISSPYWRSLHQLMTIGGILWGRSLSIKGFDQMCVYIHT